MRYIFVLIGLSLSACGSSGSEPSVDALQARAADSDQMIERLRALSPTSERRVPTTGTAQFTGYSGLIIDPVFGSNLDDVVMLGDVTLEVSYADAGQVTGQATNFDAIVGTGDVSIITPASGTIFIGQTSSGIGGDRPRNEWQSDYAGRVRVGDDTYDVTGTLEGGLLGNRVSDPTPDRFVKGIFGNDFTARAFPSGGGQVPAVFEVVAENP